MRKSDTIVIGSGLAGLIAALASAERGQKVTLLSYGSGSLSLNSGVIDVLGYDEHHVPVTSPRKGIGTLPDTHPYRKVGMEMIEKAVAFFLDTTNKYHLPYRGSLDRQIFVPTAVGTMKPTCLAPKSLDGSGMDQSSKAVIVGIKGLKDFYADIMVENLKKALPNIRQYELMEVDTGLTGGRDITTLDVARWMETEDGFRSFVEQAKSRADAKTVFVLPQILGTEGDSCAERTRDALGAEVVETTCLPPSVNGLRLQALLLKALRNNGATIVEDAKVIRAVTEGSRCAGVVTWAGVREKTYRASKFILATGGFYSGGIAMREFDHPKETIFGLPVWFPEGEENWSNKELFSDQPQGFAKTGILVDEKLCPVDKDGKRILDNVHVVGRNLGGYDFCFEHSGNGVALVSAYKAAQM